MRYQPRFVAYARTLGITPDEAASRLSGNMAPYIAWIQGQWTEFLAAHGPLLLEQKHDRFDAWLDARTQ